MKFRNSLPSLLLALAAMHLVGALPKPTTDGERRAENELKGLEESGSRGGTETAAEDQEEEALKETAAAAASSRQRERNPVVLQKKATVWNKNDTPDRNSNNNNEDNESYRKFSGIRYTPQDLAEYILKTRDEEGVALAIEELLQEGLIRRDEAIQYLESVKSELGNMKQQYALAQETKAWQHVHPNTITASTYDPVAKQEKSREFHARIKELQRTGEKRKYHFGVPDGDLQVRPLKEKAIHRNPSPIQQQFIKDEKSAAAAAPVKEAEPTKDTPQNSTHVSPMASGKAEVAEKRTQPAVTYSEPKVKEMASNALYEEYLLEKVIYQLAKDMFTQSLMKDDASAEQLLSKFASFLENELSQKRFSKATKEKILDTVSSALIESLRERLYNGN